MRIFVMVDKNYGISFNKRRQTQDKVLREYILSVVKQNTLYMNEYSYKQFMNTANNIKVDNKYLELAKPDEYCFVEMDYLKDIEYKISELYMCKWNRKYPADKFLDIVMNTKWRMEDIIEIVGSSHDKITIEKWINKNYLKGNS